MLDALHLKTSSAKVLSYGILFLLAYLPFHPFFTAWIGSLTDVYAPVKIWKDVFVAAVALLLLSYSLSDASLRQKVWKDTLNLAVFGYAAVHFLFFLVFGNFSEESSFAGLIFNLRFLAFFTVVRIFIAAFPSYQRVTSRYAVKVLLGGALIVGAIALVQLALPTKGIYEFFGYDGVNTISPVSYVDNDPDAPRAFSTLRGPNELGSYLIIPITLLSVLLMAGYRRWQVFFLLAVTSGALIGSYSRSALIGCVVAIIAAATLFYGRRINRKHKIISLFSVVVVLGVSIWLSITVPQLRLFVYHSSPGDPSLFEGSTEDHFRATERGLRDAVANPLGRGPGESGPASFYQTDDTPRIPENYYVQIAQETGLVGLVLLLSMLSLVGKRLFDNRQDPLSLAFFAGFIGLSVTNLFLHTWADDTTAYIWWGMAALIIGYNDRNSWKKSKDSSRLKT